MPLSAIARGLQWAALRSLLSRDAEGLLGRALYAYGPVRLPPAAWLVSAYLISDRADALADSESPYIERVDGRAPPLPTGGDALALTA
jgi:hypothetical protein